MFKNPSRFFDNDGTELNPGLAAKPSLCTTCKKDDDPSQLNLCDLNRLDQKGEDEFQCGEYSQKESEYQ